MFFIDSLWEAAKDDWYGKRCALPGSIVKYTMGCGYIDHTGIVIDEGYVVEWTSNGCLEKIHFTDFLSKDPTDGAYVSVACNENNHPIHNDELALVAEALYEDQNMLSDLNGDYDILINNCHNFINICMVIYANVFNKIAEKRKVTALLQLENRIKYLFNVSDIRWREADYSNKKRLRPKIPDNNSNEYYYNYAVKTNNKTETSVDKINNHLLTNSYSYK